MSEDDSPPASGNGGGSSPQGATTEITVSLIALGMVSVGFCLFLYKKIHKMKNAAAEDRHSYTFVLIPLLLMAAAGLWLVCFKLEVANESANELTASSPSSPVTVVKDEAAAVTAAAESGFFSFLQRPTEQLNDAERTLGGAAEEAASQIGGSRKKVVWTCILALTIAAAYYMDRR